MLLGDRAVNSNVHAHLLYSGTQIGSLVKFAILALKLLQPVRIHLIVLLDLNGFKAGVVLQGRQLAKQVLRCLASLSHDRVGCLRGWARRHAQVRLDLRIHLIKTVLVLHMMVHSLGGDCTFLLRVRIGSFDSILKRDM